MPESAKERVKDFIPKDLVDKIATENDVSNVEELRAFLKERGHPIVSRWKEAEAVVEEREEAPVEMQVEAPPSAILTSAIPTGRFKVILKNAKIHVKKLRIKSRRK